MGIKLHIWAAVMTVLSLTMSYLAGPPSEWAGWTVFCVGAVGTAVFFHYIAKFFMEQLESV